MNIIEFYENLKELYPDSLSAAWDNDGLMCCPDRRSEVRRVLISLDASMAALEYAKQHGFDTLLTHHPLIFKGLKSLNGSDPVSRRVLFAISNNISVISMHTRLDAGAGGVNDALCEALGLYDIKVFGDEDCPTLGRIGTTDAASNSELAEKIKTALGVPSVTAYICREPHRIAVVGGSGSDYAGAAKAYGADTLITGEVKHDKGMDFSEDGINVFSAGHYFTEFPVCLQLSRLASSIADAETEIFKRTPVVTY